MPQATVFNTHTKQVRTTEYLIRMTEHLIRIARVLSYEILRTCMYCLNTIKGYIQSNNMIHLTYNETYAMLHKYNSA